jgi:hypothetical protein
MLPGFEDMGFAQNSGRKTPQKITTLRSKNEMRG